jgi:hypothetical protein
MNARAKKNVSMQKRRIGSIENEIRNIEDEIAQIEKLVTDKHSDNVFSNLLFLIDAIREETSTIRDMKDRIDYLNSELRIINHYMLSKRINDDSEETIYNDYMEWREKIINEHEKKEKEGGKEE